MQILITPEDIIKRCLFSKYKKFVLNKYTKKEITEIIEKNELTVINENDAFVIGLLKVIETDNLIHRFNLEIEEFVKIKTTVINGDVIISKYAILKEVSEFIDRFPDVYKPELSYQKAIDDMKEYVNSVYKKIDDLNVIKIEFHDNMINYILSKEVNKIVKFKL